MKKLINWLRAVARLVRGGNVVLKLLKETAILIVAIVLAVHALF